MAYLVALGGESIKNTCRYICIVRNPKNVCASYYDFESGKSWSGYYSGLWDHWLDMFTSGRVQCGDWFKRTLSWSSQNRQHHLLQFEDLKLDTPDQLDKMAKFLGVTVSKDQLVRDRARLVTTPCSRPSSELKDIKEFGFFREGKVGPWKEYFTVAQSEVFGRLYEEQWGS